MDKIQFLKELQRIQLEMAIRQRPENLSIHVKDILVCAFLEDENYDTIYMARPCAGYTDEMYENDINNIITILKNRSYEQGHIQKRSGRRA